eukprot:13818308-Alexandrium_andersonii.AAC.1
MDPPARGLPRALPGAQESQLLTQQGRPLPPDAAAPAGAGPAPPDGGPVDFSLGQHRPVRAGYL